MVQAFEQVVGTPGCRLLTVIGPAGVGKSRLARELLSVRGGDATLVQGRCLPYGEGITFWPLREAVRQAANLSGLEAPAEARRKIRRLVASASDADLIAERMLETLDLAADTAGSNAIFWATGRLFRELARTQPLIVLFDDVQWAEATFLDLVEYLRQDLRAAPILLLCLARPEFLDLRPSWAAGESDARVLVLEPLPESDSAQLVAGLLGDSDQASHAVARINAATEGNPFFVEELVSMLIEEGRLRRERGSWRPVDELAAISLPPTIGALLAARIDALPSGERAALERASIEGKVFNRDAALRLTPPAEKAAFAVHLDALIRRELIQRTRLGADEDSFEFRHQLLRDAAYEAIPKTRRAQLHERFANWLEQRAGQHTAEHAEILGYHLEQAQRYRTELRPVGETELARRAADYLATAGIRAHARGDMPATVSLVARAVNLLPAESSERRKLTAMHEDALFEIGQLRRTRFSPARMRCFWRWPFGHHWTLRERGGRPVLRCDDCGKTVRGYRRRAESAIDRGLIGGGPGA
jgi:predicted ATPase